MSLPVKVWLIVVIGGIVGGFLGMKAAQIDLGGRIACWLGLHWWTYNADRHRRCLRGYCGQAEENIGFVGRAERWVKHG